MMRLTWDIKHMILAHPDLGEAFRKLSLEYCLWYRVTSFYTCSPGPIATIVRTYPYLDSQLSCTNFTLPPSSPWKAGPHQKDA